MLKNITHIIKKKIEIFILILLVIFTAISTQYFNYKKKINDENYNNFNKKVCCLQAKIKGNQAFKNKKISKNV